MTEQDYTTGFLLHYRMLIILVLLPELTFRLDLRQVFRRLEEMDQSPPLIMVILQIRQWVLMQKFSVSGRISPQEFGFIQRIILLESVRSRSFLRRLRF